jgi:hypothetical protein
MPCLLTSLPPFARLLTARRSASLTNFSAVSAVVLAALAALAVPEALVPFSVDLEAAPRAVLVVLAALLVLVALETSWADLEEVLPAVLLVVQLVVPPPELELLRRLLLPVRRQALLPARLEMLLLETPQRVLRALRVLVPVLLLAM